jgi:tetratricopeptide (TPR) repeat protein
MMCALDPCVLKGEGRGSLVREEDWLMKHCTTRVSLWLIAGALLLCAASSPSIAVQGQIPVTTSSDAARAAYEQARELTNNLKLQESLAYYETAVADDPTFALGYFDLAFAQAAVGNVRGLFENLEKAVALADGASNGERLLILGAHAGVNDNPTRQRELYLQLVQEYPQARRAHYAMGLYYYGQREFSSAVRELEEAIKLSPDYATAYNNLGYAYSRLGKYEEAERAFNKYTELIPDEPNPYDSLGELLMKEGKFDESMAAYKKALSLDPAFYASYVGVGMDLAYTGKPEEGRASFQELHDIAPTDAQRRQALFWVMISYLDEGSFDEALRVLDERYMMTDRGGDPSAIAADLGIMGDVLLEKGDVDGADAKYIRSAQVIAGSDLSQEVKDEAAQGLLFNEVRIALARGNVPAAETKAGEYRARAEAGFDPLEMELYHQLAGMIALHEKRFDEAIHQLGQANLRDPRNLCRLARAYEGKGDKVHAREMWAKAADFNELNYGYAFVRRTARARLAEM